MLHEWSGPAPTLDAMRAGGRIQPPKVRAFLDFLVPRLNLTEIRDENLAASH